MAIKILFYCGVIFVGIAWLVFLWKIVELILEEIWDFITDIYYGIKADGGIKETWKKITK